MGKIGESWVFLDQSYERQGRIFGCTGGLQESLPHQCGHTVNSLTSDVDGPNPQLPKALPKHMRILKVAQGVEAHGATTIRSVLVGAGLRLNKRRSWKTFSRNTAPRSSHRRDMKIVDSAPEKNPPEVAKGSKWFGTCWFHHPTTSGKGHRSNAPRGVGVLSRPATGDGPDRHRSSKRLDGWPHRALKRQRNFIPPFLAPVPT